MADPIHQFQIVNYFPLGKIGSVNLAFTNSALYMGIAVGIIAALMLGATAQRQLVPGRLQSVAELAYEFIADTLRNTVGEGGMQFFPLVFSLFMFILVSNMVGLIPSTDSGRTACIFSKSSCRVAFQSTFCHLLSCLRCFRSSFNRCHIAYACSRICWPVISPSRCSPRSSPCWAGLESPVGSARPCPWP